MKNIINNIEYNNEWNFEIFIEKYNQLAKKENYSEFVVEKHSEEELKKSFMSMNISIDAFVNAILYSEQKEITTPRYRSSIELSIENMDILLKQWKISFKEYIDFIIQNNIEQKLFENDRELEKIKYKLIVDWDEKLSRNHDFIVNAYNWMNNKYWEPVLNHSVEVASILCKYSCTPIEIWLAQLHDIDEDCNQEVKNSFKNSFKDEYGEHLKFITEIDWDWNARKKDYLEKIKYATPEAKIVSIADKIWFLRSFIDWYSKEWEKIVLKFHNDIEECKKSYIWFFQNFQKNVSTNFRHPILSELNATLTKFLSLLR